MPVYRQQHIPRELTSWNILIFLQFESLEIHVLALVWNCNPGVQGTRLFSRLRNMVTRSWDNSPTEARPARHCFHTPAVLAKQRHMSGLSFHPRRGDRDPGNLHQLGH
uniref:Uncharacterized protein n=1 Tax=Oryza brachyantha TaxID=4533 RepID=J3LI11_ORYBR